MSEPARDGLPAPDDRPALGAELIIPVLAIAFAGYFLATTTDLVWEAKANGIVVGTVLILLAGLQIGRIWWRVRAGRASLSLGEFARLSRPQARRLALVGLMALFVATIDLLGTCLGLILAMGSSMAVMGVRDWRWLVGLPAATATVVYLLFIAFLGSRLPRGPVEQLLGALFGGSA